MGTGLFRTASFSDVSPSLWWADERSWCVATEVDFRWTYVGASAACIASILADPRIEALPVEPDQRADYRSDAINGVVEPYPLQDGM